MDKPKDTYNNLKSITNINNIAYQKIIINNLGKNITGKQKMTDIDSTDTESKLLEFSNLPVPGMIYTFFYLPGSALSILNTQFVDVMPILFCMNAGSDYFSGVNLNMLPAKQRLDFLDKFYTIYESFYSKTEEIAATNKAPLNLNFLKYVKSFNSGNFMKYMSLLSDVKLPFAFRRYNPNCVYNLRYIEYNDWKYIPFVTSNNLFRKADLNLIYKLYKIYKPKKS